MYTKVQVETEINYKEARKVARKVLVDHLNMLVYRHLKDMGVTYNDFVLKDGTIHAFMVHPHDGDNFGDVLTAMTEEHVFIAKLINDLK